MNKNIKKNYYKYSDLKKIVLSARSSKKNNDNIYHSYREIIYRVAKLFCEQINKLKKITKEKKEKP